MSRAKLNPWLAEVHGATGDLVFKEYFGRTIICKKPSVSDRAPTPLQLAAREAFRRAALYGKSVFANPELHAIYKAAAAIRQLPVLAVALKDYFVKPTVDEVNLEAYTGQTGNKISIRAIDDFEVMGVQVEISKQTGDPVESGAATHSALDPMLWEYTATATSTGSPLKVVATATDRPGNKGSKTETK